jgi:hypothetical protein
MGREPFHPGKVTIRMMPWGRYGVVNRATDFEILE